MSRVAYINRRFNKDTMALVDQVSELCDSYIAQGLQLTVRQLFYQLVAKNIVANTFNSYKRVASLVNDARLGGYIDWDAIEDRTRAFLRRPRWTSGKHALEDARDNFHMDLWAGQPVRPFVVVEKEALAGVLWRACSKWDVPVLPARGYPSVTVLRDFAIEDANPCFNSEPQQDVLILHLGDHDPSGIDMTRDLFDRVDLFTTHILEVRRIALTMAQVRETNAPPNRAKTTDSRITDYKREHGNESWELDALPPSYLYSLIDRHIEPLIDKKVLEKQKALIESEKERLTKLMKTYDRQKTGFKP